MAATGRACTRTAHHSSSPAADAQPVNESGNEDNTARPIPTLDGEHGIPHISGETLHDMLEGRYDAFFKRLYVLDCRYPHEYAGGHIRGALHVGGPAEVLDMFFPDVDAWAVVVFYCELSSVRAPRSAEAMRNTDRCVNKDQYPALCYPWVFVLDGGYRKYFAGFEGDCDGGYVPMVDGPCEEVARANAAYRAAVADYQRWKGLPQDEVGVKVQLDSPQLPPPEFGPIRMPVLRARSTLEILPTWPSESETLPRADEGQIGRYASHQIQSMAPPADPGYFSRCCSFVASGGISRAASGLAGPPSLRPPPGACLAERLITL